MYHPDLETLKEAARGYDIVPVAKDIFADVRTPIAVMRALKKVSSCCFLLESARQGEKWGRYSFLGYDPKMLVACKDHVMTVKDGVSRQYPTDDPAGEIRKVLSQYRSPRLPGMPTFTGGLVGYFAFESVKYAEPRLDLLPKKETPFNDVDLMLFDKVIAFDHLAQKIVLIVNIRTDDLERNYYKALRELDDLASLVAEGEAADIPGGKLLSDFQGEFTPEEFEQVVRKTQHYIKEGDIFQAVPSNCLSADFEGSLFNAYRVLRIMNPSPYMFYFSGRDIELTGASPETLTRLQDGVITTFPIAGTNPRGKTPEEDKALEEELLHDEKELAEHDMLVDLGRNDVGRIAQIGSVSVEHLHKIERFSHVMHITTEVTGRIRKDKDALDAIAAMLPAGTLSGAPKIRAIEILHELEKSPRAMYGGAIGYIDFTGNMDVCIGIRMAAAAKGKVYVRSGAGIVKDSQPEKEYYETVNKAKSMMEAIRKGEEDKGYDIAH